MKSISIIGCGWFGLPLAKQLLNGGYKVSGTKRSEAGCEQLTELGVESYLLDLSLLPSNSPVQDSASTAVTAYNELLDVDALVINIPPGLRRGESQYLVHIQRLMGLIGQRQYQRIIFISTTGVYPAEDKVMYETDANAYDAKSDILLAAESLVAEKDNACIVRFSGLIGPKRHPGKFFAGKADVSGANVAVNLVHLDDCIQAIDAILFSTFAGQAVANYYNLSAPSHPSRADFYQAATRQLGLAAPQFNDVIMPSKIINGDLICQQLNFNYIHPDPLTMLEHC
ncbi:SDR family oxidoreductase [Shewanella donghaensis]|uniref:SDR family oxidoreductase n=1 Tax=Shewanella donghaensis TaxID=238836 RepID=UPI00118455A1|nr:SDR family oxidoreductase [Shewanella donghaensis]